MAKSKVEYIETAIEILRRQLERVRSERRRAKILKNIAVWERMLDDGTYRLTARRGS